LPAAGQTLLIALALYKVRRFLEHGLRLRTACDLVIRQGHELKATAPAGFAIPTTKELADLLPRLIDEAHREKDLLAPDVLRLKTKTVKKAGKEKGAKSAAEGELSE
jgi:CRISPR-associated protein Csb1